MLHFDQALQVSLVAEVLPQLVGNGLGPDVLAKYLRPVRLTNIDKSVGAGKLLLRHFKELGSCARNALITVVAVLEGRICATDASRHREPGRHFVDNAVVELEPSVLQRRPDKGVVMSRVDRAIVHDDAVQVVTVDLVAT